MKLCKTRPIKRISKKCAYLIMKKILIEKIAKLLSHSILSPAQLQGLEVSDMETIDIIVYRQRTTRVLIRQFRRIFVIRIFSHNTVHMKEY